MVLLKHYLITRFNLRRKGTDKANRSTLTSEWLQHRINLFKTYCLPSIKEQSNLNFKWLVLYDAQTDPNIYLKYKDFKNLVPVLCDSDEHGAHQMIYDLIHSELNLENKYVIITTRIDSDDGFNKDAIKNIQDLSIAEVNRGQKATFAINFHRGLYLNERKSILKPEYIHFTSAYTSLVEPNTNRINKYVMSFGQGELTRKHHTIWVKKGEPMWLRVIHTRNILNSRMFGFDDHKFNINNFSYIPQKFQQILSQYKNKPKPIKDHKSNETIIKPITTPITKPITTPITTPITNVKRKVSKITKKLTEINNSDRILKKHTKITKKPTEINNSDRILKKHTKITKKPTEINISGRILKKHTKITKKPTEINILGRILKKHTKITKKPTEINNSDRILKKHTKTLRVSKDNYKKYKKIR